MNEGALKGFEYFVLRFVPRVDREEFVNVGIVLYSQDFEFLDAACRVEEDRLRALAPGADLQDVKAALEAVETICRGEAGAGPAAGMGPRQRFDWLSAPRSTVVQPGPVHSGLTRNPAAELQRLLGALVLETPA
ncbi:MAG TPA: DUF3037 domain-containing protein [Actinomycetota bacterium]|nr:DUF3037 domain-containing protein [Actinomycetota bacterium]